MDSPEKSRAERTPRVDEEITRTTEAFDSGTLDASSPREAHTHENLVDREDPHKQLEIKQLLERVEKALDKLDPRDAVVVRLRFGLLDHPTVAALGVAPDDKQVFTLDRVAQLLGISCSRVQQLEKRTLKILTSVTERKKLAAYFEKKLPDAPDWNQISRLSNKSMKEAE